MSTTVTYRFIYQRSECNRIVPSVLIDNRANIPAIMNKTGAEIKVYTDIITSSILGREESLFYKIESPGGHLAGFFSMNPGNRADFIPYFKLRSAFQPFEADIYNQILNFVQSGAYKADQLN